MAEAGFGVRIITPEDVFLESRAESLVAPGAEGYLGVLQSHAPLVTPLVPGVLTLRFADRTEKKYQIEGGFLEVSRNQVLILVERIADFRAVSSAG